MKERFIAYLVARMREASTWQGLVLVLTAGGAHLSPEQREAIAIVGLFAAGVIGAVFPNQVKEDQ